jgi:hypothetical protein
MNNFNPLSSVATKTVVATVGSHFTVARIHEFA